MTQAQAEEIIGVDLLGHEIGQLFFKCVIQFFPQDLGHPVRHLLVFPLRPDILRDSGAERGDFLRQIWIFKNSVVSKSFMIDSPLSYTVIT